MFSHHMALTCPDPEVMHRRHGRFHLHSRSAAPVSAPAPELAPILAGGTGPAPGTTLAAAVSRLAEPADQGRCASSASRPAAGPACAGAGLRVAGVGEPAEMVRRPCAKRAARN